MLIVKNSPRKTYLSILRFCLLLSLLTQTALATEDNNFEVEQLFQKLQKTEATVIQFSEIKRMSFLDTQLTQQGELEFRPPDYLRRELTHPVSEKTIVTGEQIIVTTANGVRNISMTDHPIIAALISAIRAPLTGTTEEVRKWFDINLQGNDNEWVIKLTPRQPPLSTQLSSMILRGKTDHLHSVETLEKNQDSSLVIFNQPSLE